MQATVNNINLAFSRCTIAGDKVDKLVDNDRHVVIRQRLTAQVVWCLLQTTTYK